MKVTSHFKIWFKAASQHVLCSSFYSSSSFLFSGTLVTLPPPSMKEFNITDTGVKIDVAAIEWPAKATALVYDGCADALVCRTTDPDESKDSAATSEIRIKCGRDQVIGTSLAVSRNDPIRMRSHEPYNLLVRSSRTRFLIPHFIPSLSSPSHLQVPSTRSCSPRACRVWTSATARASQVRLRVRDE